MGISEATFYNWSKKYGGLRFLNSVGLRIWRKEICKEAGGRFRRYPREIKPLERTLMVLGQLIHWKTCLLTSTSRRKKLVK